MKNRKSVVDILFSHKSDFDADLQQQLHTWKTLARATDDELVEMLTQSLSEMEVKEIEVEDEKEVESLFDLLIKAVKEDREGCYKGYKGTELITIFSTEDKEEFIKEVSRQQNYEKYIAKEFNSVDTFIKSGFIFPVSEKGYKFWIKFLDKYSGKKPML